MYSIVLDEQAVLRVQVILMDGDEKAALQFLREVILPEVQRHKGVRMKNHLDGGKGSAL